jgi:endogenous inhibitor of DNA gyrase (YacG/DUF329 family)
MPSVVMVQSGNENRNENRYNDNRGIRVCEHCQKEYVARHFKQRFCSTGCRLDFHKFILHKKQIA